MEILNINLLLNITSWFYANFNSGILRYFIGERSSLALKYQTTVKVGICSTVVKKVLYFRFFLENWKVTRYSCVFVLSLTMTCWRNTGRPKKYSWNYKIIFQYFYYLFSRSINFRWKQISFYQKLPFLMTFTSLVGKFW